MRLAVMMCLLAGPALAATADAADKYQWLESVDSARAVAWVKAQNAKSLSVLKADPHYAGFYSQALAIGQAQDRVPLPAQINGRIYNFWQDATHVRGVWRRTSVEGYRAAAPQWTNVLDLDAVAKAEHANWVWKGANCLEPEERLCLTALSDGGEDAVVEREFDLHAGAFVAGGFSLPRAKTGVDWENANSLLAATDWGAGSMTASGYPYIVKRLKRGAPISAATEVFRGKPSDVQVTPMALNDGSGHSVMLIQEGLDFFRSAWFRVTASGTEKLPLPEKILPLGLLNGALILRLDQDWAWPGGKTIPAGSIAAFDLTAKGATPQPVFVPGARQSVDEAAVTRDRIVAAVYDHVRGEALVFSQDKSGWHGTRVALPDNVSVNVVSTTIRDNQAFLNVSGFLTPNGIWFANLDAGTALLARQSPARFDSSGDTVEQFEATSTDGTKIPYFVVHPKQMKLAGQNPTLLYAYGGFQVSEVPAYNGVLGKLWLEHGGVYVLANIRGGGEFGPAWHEAALKTHRQRAYDDFAAVGRDLIARKITSPRRLGIEGGSNGGLLMGVEFEQHPDLWHATVIQVPLLDMLRFEQIAAGASWVGEYGSVSNPAERANLARLSPYANLKAGMKYPTPFIYTTSKDDRVGPQHARKFAAKMSELRLPYLYYEAVEGGHGAGANAREQAEERALEMTYLTRQLMQ